MDDDHDDHDNTLLLVIINVILLKHLGPISQRDLSPDLDLNFKTLGLNLC